MLARGLDEQPQVIADRKDQRTCRHRLTTPPA